MNFASMTWRTFILEGVVLAGVSCLGKEGAPISVVVPEPKSPIPPAAATTEVTATIVPPTPTRIAIATPTLRPLEAVPSPYAVVTRAIDDARDILDAKKNVIATLNGNRNLISFTEDGPLTETQLKALMEKNNIGLAFKNGLKGNPDKLFKMEKGELKEIPIPQLTTRLTPNDFWSDMDNPENPHGLMTEKVGTKTHVIFDGKNWIEYVDGKSTGRVVFDMQKEPAAVGGAVPGAKETVVTVTPKPPQKETPKIPVLGITKEGNDLDDLLAKMQTNPPNVPGTITVNGMGISAALLQLETPGTKYDQNKNAPPSWEFKLKDENGRLLQSSVSISGDEVDLVTVKIVANSGITEQTGVRIKLDSLGIFKGKKIIVIGISSETAKNTIQRWGLKAIGISR